MKPTLSASTDNQLFCWLAASHREAEQAFAELYARYGQKLYLYCRKVMGSNSDAHDAFQEVWMQFHAAGKNGTAVQNVSSYLFRIARNVCLNRKRSARTFLNIEDLECVSHDKPYEQRELLSLIDRALDVLDDEYREAFVLHEMHGMAYGDIAAITGDTIPALKNRVWRARKQIRELVAPLLADL